MFYGDDLVYQKRRRDFDAARRARVAYDHECMAAGPELAADGYTLVVPSNVYNEEAKGFWKSKGFRFDGIETRWVRDTRRPFAGKRYPAATWLARTRAKFYEFYPQYTPTGQHDERVRPENNGIMDT